MSLLPGLAPYHCGNYSTRVSIPLTGYIKCLFKKYACLCLPTQPVNTLMDIHFLHSLDFLRGLKLAFPTLLQLNFSFLTKRTFTEQAKVKSTVLVAVVVTDNAP